MSKNNTKRKGGWLAAVLLLLAVTAVAYLILSGTLSRWLGGSANDTLDKLGISVSTDRETYGVESVDNLVITVGKTGMRAYDSKGQICWDIAFSMQAPKLSVCGEYALAADYGATQACLVKVDGTNLTITAEAPILFARVDEGGRVLLAATDGKRNSLSLYDATGALLLRRVTYQNKDGIPVAAAVSADGKRLAGAYVSYTGGSLCTNVTIFDLSDNGADLTDRILGNYRLEEQLVSDLWFSGRSLIFVGDAELGVIDAERDCKPVWTVSPAYEVTFAAASDGTLAIVLGDRKAGTASPAEEYFFLYDINGRVLYHGLSDAPTSLAANAGVFTVGDGRSFSGFSSRGKLLWEKEFSFEYQRMLPLADRKTAVAVNTELLEYYYVRNKWEVDKQ